MTSDPSSKSAKKRSKRPAVIEEANSDRTVGIIVDEGDSKVGQDLLVGHTISLPLEPPARTRPTNGTPLAKADPTRPIDASRALEPTAPMDSTPTLNSTTEAEQEREASAPPVSPFSILLDAYKLIKPCLSSLWSLRAPLFLLGSIALIPKLVHLWIFIVIAKPISVWASRLCPENWRTTFKRSLPKAIRNSPFVQDLGEGADQGLPFILFWLYLCCAPFAIAWIALHWMKGFFHSHSEPKCENGLAFTQNKRADPVRSETNFYYSRAFGLVFIAFFALGIPAYVSYAVYETLGIEQLVRSGPTTFTSRWAHVGHQSVPPSVSIPEVGLATRRKAPVHDYRKIEDATYVTGYHGYWPYLRDLGIEPTTASVFFVHFYLVSLASALCMLFFRAWFLFPLNFLSDEHDIEFTEFGIKRKSLMQGWFLSVVTINRWSTGGGPNSLPWNEVKSLRRLEEGFFKLCPLPETAFKKESLSYKLLNKLAAFIDAVSHRPNNGNYLVFSTTEDGDDFGRHIKINLNDLNQEQRARLLYSVKSWAPHVTIKEDAEEHLLGSRVLENYRYTQLWFDMLTSKPSIRKHTLGAGEFLKNGEYTIQERICSGGQGTTYSAITADGEKCVLKEFILCPSSNTTATIESAREFEAEVSLLSQLHHPGIVRLEDFFFEDGRVYIKLEFIEGQSLREMVQQRGPLSEDEVVRIARSTCDVLEYLHSQNPPIVHRDVTPENILLRPDGTIKLIDFSLAVKQDGQKTTDSCAKQAFTPPEQFREEVCVQSDIYALGATMYYLLTGVLPKPISSSSPRTKAPHVSETLNAIIERATQLDLSTRYESASWLKLDLATLSEQKHDLCYPVAPPHHATSTTH